MRGPARTPLARANGASAELPALAVYSASVGPWRNAPWGLWLSGLAYAVLILPTLARQGIGWDEQTDLLVARSYLAPDGLWIGSHLDPINVRLPMYLPGLLFQWTGPDLLVARLLSCAAGLGTLVATWLWCRREFGRRCASLACLVLATSPYFLGYARYAFTEGDVYVACAVAWLAVAVSRFDRLPSRGRAAGIGVALGLAASSKISALALGPALAIWLVWRGPEAGLATRLRHSLLPLATIAAVATATFFAVPPVHATNPIVRDALFAELVSGGRGLDPLLVAESVAFHVLVLTFRPSPGVGALLWGAAIAAVWQARRRPALRFPVLAGACYGAFMCTLPWAQGHYMMPVFPLLVVLAADAAGRLFDRHRLWTAGAGAVLAALLVVDLVRVYPDFNLNGYQWVGERTLAGRATLGSRAIAEVRSDGIEQALRWASTRATRSDRVVMFVRAPLIVESVLPRPHFALQDGLRDPTLLKRADYVITSIGTQLDNGWGRATPAGPIRRYPYNRPLLVRHFTRVFSVERAFGLEVAAVWRRNRPRPLPSLEPDE